MKTNSFNITTTTITAGLAAILITPAFAIEAPADDAPPPPLAEAPAGEARPPAAEQDAKPEAKVDTAYLGVVSSVVPEMLADHLGLKQGEGIIVRAVMPEGPAAKAGLEVNDIVTRVGDKAVGSPQDLTDQVTALKPGENIHLDVIHKGKPAGLDVTLGKRPDQFAGMENQPLDQLNLEGLPKEFADRIRGMIAGNLGMQLDIQEGAVDIAPQFDDAMRQLRKRMEENNGAMLGLGNALGGMKLDIQEPTYRLLDEKGSVELKSNDGGKEVTIRDKDNKVTWNGPWDTEQDKAAAPEEIRKRVDRLNLDGSFKGKGFRLRGLPMDQEEGE
jgi:hypothetical protein